ncbi:lysophospholipid acyltransferase family protein [Holospora undulata]|uniref:1-acyl-sn-glycerol-3-phosphate acyltransferase n=1 Tax=Holospora undulata HU1 TaxID=1321371 RepID=A0A061JH59_9PROT|nr:lysophospholipid acyltransferase family protein [Holospora undulata]ETZ04543.1 1-acyl-sn-glycerol-3-phosphate acyltransferase [Holospora undulata HU1]
MCRCGYKAVSTGGVWGTMSSKSSVLRFKQNRVFALLGIGGVGLLLLLGGVIGGISFLFPSCSFVVLLKKILYKGIRRCAGVHKVVVRGSICKEGVFAVSNHISYLDIVLLGEQAPYVFIAKEEVKNWPLVGWIAKKFGTIFIKRTLRGIHNGQTRIKKTIQQNKAVLVFAEGTTGNGIVTEPFYHAFFELHPEVKIQPISICYTEVNGFPALSWVRRYLSWIGNVALFPHLFKCGGWRSLTVVIIFHPPFTAGSSRKLSAARSVSSVRAGISQSLKMQDFLFLNSLSKAL